MSRLMLLLPFLGFACPAARADDPAWLGVRLGPIPEALAAHLKDARGAIVDDVVPGSPAEKAGLKRFDMIVAVGGKTLEAPDEVRAIIQQSKSGDTVKLGVLRGTEKLTFDVVLGSAPAELPGASEKIAPEKPEPPRRAFLGLGTVPIPEPAFRVLAHQLGLEEGHGLIIGEVVKGSPAEKAGLLANDIVTAVDGKAVEGPEEFVKSLSAKKPGDEVKIDFIQKGEKKSAAVALGEWPKDLPEPGAAVSGGTLRRGWGPFFGPPGMKPLHRGRVTIRTPNGEEHSFQIPETLLPDDLFKDLEKKFDAMKDHQLPELKDNIDKALKDLKRKFKDDGVSSWSSGASSSVVRSVDGGYDITIRDENGVRTVTVLQDGKKVAENVPWEKLDTLPADVRERVEKVSETLKVETGGKLRLLPVEQEDIKLKA